MSQLSLIIKTEYLTDIRSKSFWISTILVPVLCVVFGIVMGILMAQSDTATTLHELDGSADKDLNGLQVLGLLSGILLTIFLMLYGAALFNKVKVEKCNRIVEVLATCVTGRTLMLAKIISVGLIGLTQLATWLLLILGLSAAVFFLTPVEIPWDILTDHRIWIGLLWAIPYFIGGYIFFGSLFAAVGAMTDKNNENQEMVSVLTFILLGCFYISMYAVDHPESALSVICCYVPFTSPTIAAVNAITGSIPWWLSLIQLLILWGFSVISLRLAGKIYTSSLLLKGKRFTPKDIVTFLKSK